MRIRCLSFGVDHLSARWSRKLSLLVRKWYWALLIVEDTHITQYCLVRSNLFDVFEKLNDFWVIENVAPSAHIICENGVELAGRVCKSMAMNPFPASYKDIVISKLRDL